MNPRYWVIKEHSIVARRIDRILGGWVGHIDVVFQQEACVEVVDLIPVPRPQRGVMYSSGMIGMYQLASCLGRLNADVAVEEGKASHVVG